MLKSQYYVWLSMTTSVWDEMARLRERAYQQKKAGGRLDLIAVGTFRRIYPNRLGDSYQDTLDFKFELIRFETAGPVN
jgi:hypothetical protein